MDIEALRNDITPSSDSILFLLNNNDLHSLHHTEPYPVLLH
jgi:hypothetical protein